MFHLGELDLACYDKDYAPAAERHAARAAHLAAWPAVIDAAVASLDAVPAPGGGARCSAASGGWRPASRPTPTRGARERRWPRTGGWSPTWSGRRVAGPPDAALGPAALAALLVAAEAIDVDLGRARRPGRRRAGPAAGAAGRSRPR